DGRVIFSGDLLLEVQAVYVGKLDVQDEAGREVGPVMREILADRTEGDRRPPQRRQELAQGFANTCIIVDDEDNMSLRIHVVSRPHAASLASRVTTALTREIVVEASCWSRKCTFKAGSAFPGFRAWTPLACPC